MIAGLSGDVASVVKDFAVVHNLSASYKMIRNKIANSSRYLGIGHNLTHVFFYLILVALRERIYCQERWLFAKPERRNQEPKLWNLQGLEGSSPDRSIAEIQLIVVQ